MTGKRFIDGGEECIEDQFLIDTSNDKYYWVSDGLDDIVKLLNNFYEENQVLLCKIEALEKENENLQKCINEIYLISSRESIE